MRVLHIGKFFPPDLGGMESYLSDLMTAQRSQRLVPAALVHRGPLSTSVDSEEEAPPIWRTPVLTQIYYTPLSPGFPRQLSKSIQQFKPDLLHIHLPNPSAFSVLINRAAHAIPWVIHWHSDVVLSAPPVHLRVALRLFHRLEARLLHQSTRIIATSPPYARTSRALKPHMDRVRVVPLGLHPSRLTCPDSDKEWANTQWKGPGLRLLGLGRLSHYKGFDRLLSAASSVTDSQVCIVGDGECYTELKQQSQAGGLMGRVQLLGHCSDGRRNAMLDTCDVLVLPSIERTEAFGVVLLEAMALGKPVIASDIPGSGPGWVVNDQGSGWLVQPGDVSDLARVFHELLKHPDRLHRAGKQGQTRFNQQFHIDKVSEGIQDVYTEALYDRAL